MFADSIDRGIVVIEAVVPTGQPADTPGGVRFGVSKEIAEVLVEMVPVDDLIVLRLRHEGLDVEPCVQEVPQGLD